MNLMKKILLRNSYIMHKKVKTLSFNNKALSFYSLAWIYIFKQCKKVTY